MVAQQITRYTPEEFGAEAKAILANGNPRECWLLYNFIEALYAASIVLCRMEAAERAEGELSTLVLKLQHIVQELPAKATAKDLRAAIKVIREELEKVEGMDGEEVIGSGL